MPNRDRSDAPSDDDVDRLAADINSAVALRESFFQRAWDRKLEEEGVIVLYALDTSILHHYFQTERKSRPSSEHPGGDFQVFAGPVTDQLGEYEEAAAGDVIAHYLVRLLPAKDLARILSPEQLARFSPAKGDEPALPLIMLPGHAYEARQIYEGFVRNFNDQRKKHGDVRDELVRILNTLDRFEGEARLKEAQDREPELHRLLYTLDAPHSKYRAYNELLLSRRLVTIRTVSQHPLLEAIVAGGRSKGAMRALRDFDRVFGEGEALDSARWWSTELNRIDFPGRYAKQDKLALAALEVLNGLLHEHRVKIVLMTTNEAIINLGNRYPANKMGPSRLRRFSFSDSYIRHPRCLFSEADIFRPTVDAKVADLTTWLDAFLAEVTEAVASDLGSFREMKAEYEKKDKRKLAFAALTSNPDLHKSFFDRWQTHLGNVNFAHVSTTPQARQIIEKVTGGGDRASVLQELEAYTKDLTETSWYQFFQTAAELGYRLIGISPEIARLSKRNPPTIYLGDMEKGEMALKFMMEDGVIRREVEILEILRELDASDDPRDKYVSVLLYALLFTFAGRWTVANLIARRAIYLTSLTPALTSHGSVSGREAFYFAAVSSRLVAKEIDDLETGREFIKNAFAALKKEEDATRKHKGSGTGAPGARVPSTLRFVAEELAIEATRLLFLAGKAGWQLEGKKGLVADIRKLMAGIDEAIAAAKEEEIEYVKVATLVNLHGNYFSCVLMLECAGVEFDLDRLREHVVDQARILKIVYHDEEGGPQPSMPDLFLLAYAASFGKYEEAEVRQIERMYWEFEISEEDRKSYCMMPYDKQRYDKIDKLIEMRA
jgi:hypothetical protein